jgi:hypothetical protein
MQLARLSLLAIPLAVASLWASVPAAEQPMGAPIDGDHRFRLMASSRTD